jgi:phosphoglycerate dehydrogenase-like enzyme
MSMDIPLVKATSPTFSKNPVMQRTLQNRPYRVVLNDDGRRLIGPSLVEFLADADGVIVGLERIDEELLQRCPKLRVVTKFGVGLDNVDLEACRRRGIYVGWTPGVNRRTVAEMALGLMIGLSHNIFLTTLQHKQGTWNKDGGYQLSGKTIGIIGLGFIGKELVELLRPFHCRILANDILDMSEYARSAGVAMVSKEEIYRTADIVTLHVPLTDKTRHMINEESLRLFRPGTFLINTARGLVVDQDALKKALQAKALRGAALDVYEEEPPSDLEFLQLPNLVCTPHIAGTAFEAVVALGQSAIDHMDAFFKQESAAPQKK